MTTLRKALLIAGGILLAIIVLTALVGPTFLANLVRDRTLHIMEEAAGPRSTVLVKQVDLDLISGDISWHGLRITQAIDSADTSWSHNRSVLIAGTIDRLDVKGLSILNLFLRRSIDMRSIHLLGPHLDLIASDRRQHNAGEDDRPGVNALAHSIRLDCLTVDSGAITWRNTRPDKPEASAKRFVLQATGIAVELPHGRTTYSLKFVTANAEADSVRAGLPPLYDLRAAHVRIAQPDSTFLIRDVTLASRKGPQEYGNVLRYETDLITFHTDSIRFRGLDISAGLNTRTLAAATVRISGTDLEDFRDKTMRDAPFKNKPMPARLLRDLPFNLRVDSLFVDSLNVAYNEKDQVTARFGQVRFEAINAVITGVDNTRPEAKPVLHVAATARVYGRAPVTFDLRTAVFDSSDHFSVKARIGALPFTAFNAMTNDLLEVRATAGRIGGIDFSMEANSNNAHGRVDIEYADLKVRIAKRDGSREKDGFRSFLANQLTRSKNVRGDKNFRHGDFTIDRLKDRQVFNYLWRGLREGMMETVLPQAVKDLKSVAAVTKPKPK